MRHIAVSHLFIQELVKTKQVIIGKVKGEKNPSDVMTRHLPTGEAMKRAIDMLGMIDLTQEGLDKHVTKHKMTAIGAINNETQEGSNNKNKKFKPWQPYTSSVTIRQYLSALNQSKKHEENPMTVMTPMLLPGNTGLTALEILLVTSSILNLMFLCGCSVAFCRWILKPGRQKTYLEHVWIARYGERAHATKECPTLYASVDVKKFPSTLEMFQGFGRHWPKENQMSPIQCSRRQQMGARATL